MSQKSILLIPGISALSIVPSKVKPKKSGIHVLEQLCMLHIIHLAAFTFDSTSPLDCMLGEDGRINVKPFLPPVEEEDEKDEEYDDDFHSEASNSDQEIPEDIVEDNYDPNSDWDLNPSEVGHVPLEDDGPKAWVPCTFSNSLVSEAAQAAQAAQDEECKQIVISIQHQLTEFGALSESMMAIVIAFSRILGTVAKSGYFELDVVNSFLEEFVILLDTMFTIDVANHLPVSWGFFKELAKLQYEVFDIYIKAETYKHAQELIWMLSNQTDFQKLFLQRCIDESVGFEGVMSEVGAAIESMLSLQEQFILKLIARLQESKDDQTSGTLKWVAV